jgi:prepilin-type N-terminal cleavage/methylation domain-containing protein
MEMKTTSRKESGFTLVELMIAMLVLGIVLTGIVKMFSSTSGYNTSQEMIVSLDQDMRAAKQLMVDEIRSAACNPKKGPGVGFLKNTDDRLNTDANSIHFTRDIANTAGDLEPDGAIDGPNEDIVYYRRNAAGNVLNVGDNTVGTLVRVTGGGAPQPLLDNVVDLQFIYYDTNANVIGAAALNTNTGLDNIAAVEVVIIGQVARPALVKAGAQQQTQRYRIRVRNV